MSTTCCGVLDCPITASVADHIIEVYPEMPNSLFFDEMNLRASCRRHNTARGVAARLGRELSGEADPIRPNPLVTPMRRVPRLY